MKNIVAASAAGSLPQRLLPHPVALVVPSGAGRAGGEHSAVGAGRFAEIFFVFCKRAGAVEEDQRNVGMEREQRGDVVRLLVSDFSVETAGAARAFYRIP